MKLKYAPIIMTQIIIWICGRILFFLIFNVSHNYSSTKFSKKHSYIFLSNHPSKYDPFLIGAYLPFSQLYKLLPLRFITTQDYMNKMRYKFVLSLCGCVSTEKKSGISVLEKSKKLLKEKNTIFGNEQNRFKRIDFVGTTKLCRISGRAILSGAPTLSVAVPPWCECL